MSIFFGALDRQAGVRREASTLMRMRNENLCETLMRTTMSMKHLLSINIKSYLNIHFAMKASVQEDYTALTFTNL